MPGSQRLPRENSTKGVHTMELHTYTAEKAKQKLIEGNQKYVASQLASIDASEEIREHAARNGQKPYAIIITCSDSRVIPEAIFSAGIGDLFVIRVAGNVIDAHQLGSIQYAAGHLGTNLVVVLGHEHCGAVHAALHGQAEGYIRSITDEIQKAIGNETDERKACCLNVLHSCEVIRHNLQIRSGQCEDGLQVAGAVYHLESGEVEFLCQSHTFVEKS